LARGCRNELHVPFFGPALPRRISCFIVWPKDAVTKFMFHFWSNAAVTNFMFHF
jgi:hypothetical protein